MQKQRTNICVSCDAKTTCISLLKFFVPETSWLRPEFALELPTDQRERILPRTTLGQWRDSVDVADDVITATETIVLL